MIESAHIKTDTTFHTFFRLIYVRSVKAILIQSDINNLFATADSTHTTTIAVMYG